MPPFFSRELIMIYCFDIDGTICSLEVDGMEEGREKDFAQIENTRPFTDVINKINRLYSEGNTIKVYTARGDVSGIDWKDKTLSQLEEWGLKFHKLYMGAKPAADLYVDDKCINIQDWRDHSATGIIAGCFDIIHPGYIKMFKDAKDVCDNLVVALHEDPSVEREHKHSPIHTVQEREDILRSIRYVDDVIRYKTENDLQSLLINTKPEFRIMGSDYKDTRFTGDDLGIPVHWHDRDHDYSYSSLRSKLEGTLQ